MVTGQVILRYEDIKMNNVKLREEIEEKIDEIGKFYNENKAVILTETDLQCILYQKLLEIETLNKMEKTNNEEDFRTHYVHTEVSWFDNNGRLTMKPDISLISPSNLTIESGSKDIRMPTKGFYFLEGGIIFELKFNRSKSSKRFLNEIKKDFEKFERLKQMNDEIFCYFVVFNKTNNKSRELDSFLLEKASSSTHKLIYKTANV